MRRAWKQIAACAVLAFALCVLFRLVIFNSYTMYVPLRGSQAELAPEEISVQVGDPDILRVGSPEAFAGHLRISVKGDRRGESELILTAGGEELRSLYMMKTDRFGTVYDLNTGNFTGDTAVLITLTVFWLLISAIMTWHFFQAKGVAFYDCYTIYFAGFSAFALVTGLVMLSVTVSRLTRPWEYNMYDAFSSICGAGKHFMELTLPMVAVFAVAMAVSNIALLRHEKPRLQNVLGLLVSGFLLTGEGLGIWLFHRDFSGSELEHRIQETMENTYATAFVYFECMLAGSVISGFKAARHRPAYDKDFIIIPGCWFRPDGSLPPLLKGRADRALAFWRSQKRETGKEARFIPSGGQGPDESMAEAEAVRRYLLSQQIPDELILTEDRSRSTFENMAFSRELMERENPDGRAAFATTNYHVFRSGILARSAGLSAEGMGSRTKWWFWPNAFMRETAGLLRIRWKQEVLFLTSMVVFFGVLSMVL